MGNKSKGNDVASQSEILEKLLMLELFKLGLSQAAIGKKLKTNIVNVNAFLKGIERAEK